MCGACMFLMLALMPLSAQSDAGVSLYGASPYLGWSLNSPSTAIMGARFDIGALPMLPLRIVPNFASAMSDTSANLLMGLGLQATVLRVKAGETRKVALYARLGGAAMWVQENPSKFVADMAYGLTLESITTPLGTRVFVEHQGLDKFKDNRLLVGLTWGR